jgi:hypothetical protein
MATRSATWAVDQRIPGTDQGPDVGIGRRGPSVVDSEDGRLRTLQCLLAHGQSSGETRRASAHMASAFRSNEFSADRRNHSRSRTPLDHQAPTGRHATTRSRRRTGPQDSEDLRQSRSGAGSRASLPVISEDASDRVDGPIQEPTHFLGESVRHEHHSGQRYGRSVVLPPHSCPEYLDTGWAPTFDEPGV